MAVTRRVVRSVRRGASPTRAARHFTRGTRGDSIPAIVWLWLLLVGIFALRRGKGSVRAGVLTVTSREVVTLLGGAAVAIAIGTFAPRTVELVLVALLIASVLASEASIVPFLRDVQARLDELQPGTAGAGGGGGGGTRRVI